LGCESERIGIESDIWHVKEEEEESITPSVSSRLDGHDRSTAHQTCQSATIGLLNGPVSMRTHMRCWSIAETKGEHTLRSCPPFTPRGALPSAKMFPVHTSGPAVNAQGCPGQLRSQVKRSGPQGGRRCRYERNTFKTEPNQTNPTQRRETETIKHRVQHPPLQTYLFTPPSKSFDHRAGEFDREGCLGAGFGARVEEAGGIWSHGLGWRWEVGGILRRQDTNAIRSLVDLSEM
jgi:hypothetical protein